jgi:hypothetical protein
MMMRKVATIAAIILLLGQSIAAAHFHRTSAQQEVSVSGSAGIADSSCALCAAHFHSPATAAVVPVLDAPAVRESIVTCAVHRGPLSTFIQNRFGRAPPASL